MSFKSQFSASRDKAHNRNIATKIHEQLSKLRAGVDASAAKKHFPILYENKHRLYDDAEILDNIKQADQLKQLLCHFKVNTVDELHAVIEKQTGTSKLLPVTQQIIASL